MIGSRGDRAIGIAIVVFAVGFGLASRLLSDTSAEQTSAALVDASAVPGAASEPAAPPAHAAPPAGVSPEAAPGDPEAPPGDPEAAERVPAQFSVGSARVRVTDRSQLRALAERMQRCPGAIEVTGHTDASGQPTENVALSLARAQAVRDVLAELLPAKELVVAGAGHAEPAASNDTPQGRKSNRRVTAACK